MRFTLIFLLSGILLSVGSAGLKAQQVLLDLYYSGKYTQVIEQCSASLSAGDTAFNTHYLKAVSEIQLGKSPEAIATLEHAQGIFPENKTVQRMLAGQYETAGAYTKAWNLYLELVETDSTDAASWLKLADIASFRQQYPRAIRALQQVLYIDSLNLNSLMMMGDILHRHNNSGALVYYEKAYRLYPDNQKAAYALGNLYIQSKKSWDAVPICEHILGMDSTNIKFRKLLGYAYYKMGEAHHAIPNFQYASVLGDSTAFTFKFMGISHYLTSNFNPAISSLDISAKKDPMDAEV